MSSIIMNADTRRELSHMVKANNKFYYVDSTYTLDCGYETMAFDCDETGEIIDFRGVYTERYGTKTDMIKGHDRICNNLEDYISNLYKSGGEYEVYLWI